MAKAINKSKAEKYLEIPEIKTVLVANRGVIAKRIMRTCKLMGLNTIGIFTANDQDMAHLPFADQVFEISDSSGFSGYMNKEKLISLALENGAAIHPGYGFLSENDRFASDCLSANVVFIGPSPQTLQIAGNKIACHQLLLKNNIPVIPSFSYIDKNDEIFNKADEIGYPLLIKPSHGGGGIGMLKVNNKNELESALLNSSLLAKQYFAEGTLLIEKLLSGARHIEVQILSDKIGNSMHLFERECSMQRRNQKVIEESPSPALDDNQREKLFGLALHIAKIIKLDNIATIEFLFHENQFYFLEVNPRIQVEHAVTEEISGIDLVEWQIRIARGETILEATKFQQINGHCIESRIYAEEAKTGFPAPGVIEYISLPDGPGIRIESAIWPCIKVPENFDPLLMKLIIKAKNREECRFKMIMALENLDINGTLKVNTMALLSALKNECFLKGNYNIHSFEEIRGMDENLWQKELAGILGIMADKAAKKVIKSSAGKNNNTSPWQSDLWNKRGFRT
jgi:acetyl/propionyl-CoA carboxylase alpha subunit